MIGRNRPVEQDAVRVLTVVHQLGEASDPPAGEGRWFIDTESQLQHLDHLVRHPIDLAYVLMDQARSSLDRWHASGATGTELDARTADLAGRVRQLLGAASLRRGANRKPRGRHRPSLLRPFDPESWQRWDDVLALLGCRGLLCVEPLPDGDQGTGELRYRVTSEGSRWLRDSIYPQQDGQAGGIWRQRCDLLRAVLPARLLRPRSHATLGPYLQDTARRLDAYSSDEHIRPEDDLLGHLFQSTFAEEL